MTIDIISDKPVADMIREKKESTAIMTPYPDDVKAEAYSLYLQGFPIYKIAERIGANPNTVSKWIKKYKAQFKTEMEEKTGVDLLSSVIEEYEFLKNFAYSQIQDMMFEVDEETGEIVKSDNPNHAALAKYLDLVQKVIKDKTGLMIQTGAIAKEPEKLNINIKGENKSEVTVKLEAEERPIEEIERDIQERLRHVKLLQ